MSLIVDVLLACVLMSLIVDVLLACVLMSFSWR
jgi:hypothetical protein